jgi:hypothetical protein
MDDCHDQTDTDGKLDNEAVDDHARMLSGGMHTCRALTARGTTA